jgi:hypothetical protein
MIGIELLGIPQHQPFKYVSRSLDLPIHLNYQTARYSEDQPYYTTVEMTLRYPELFVEFEDDSVLGQICNQSEAQSQSSNRNNVFVQKVYRYSYLGREVLNMSSSSTHNRGDRSIKPSDLIHYRQVGSPTGLDRPEIRVYMPNANLRDYEIVSLVTHIVVLLTQIVLIGYLIVKIRRSIMGGG